MSITKKWEKRTISDNLLECVLFSVANIKVIIERRHITAMRSVAASQNSVVASDGMPGVKAEELFGLELTGVSPQRQRRLLIIDKGQGPIVLEVDEPVELIDLSAERIHLLPKLLASRIKLPGIRAITTLKYGVGFVLDPAYVM
ncbi:hypothetical protein KAI46_16615 [bacterium]|nr:hypothetical protein [bacterium]